MRFSIAGKLGVRQKLLRWSGNPDFGITPTVYSNRAIRTMKYYPPFRTRRYALSLFMSNIAAWREYLKPSVLPRDLFPIAEEISVIRWYLNSNSRSGVTNTASATMRVTYITKYSNSIPLSSLEQHVVDCQSNCWVLGAFPFAKIHIYLETLLK